MLSLAHLVELGLVGGCVVLDRTAFLQCSLARPLVGASLAGWVLGVPVLGLWCGVLLELLWLTDVPMGAALPPDEALAGVLAACMSWAAPTPWGMEARAALGVVLAAPCAYLGRWVDRSLRLWNQDLVPRARDALGCGDVGGVGRAHLFGGLRFFGAGAVSTMILGSAGVAVVQGVVPILPPGTERGLELVALLLPVLGAASVMATWRGMRSCLRFACGAAAWALGTLPNGGLPWLR